MYVASHGGKNWLEEPEPAGFTLPRAAAS